MGQTLSSTHKVTKHISFRPAEISDAEFILSLRLDESKNQYLSKVEDDIEAQRKWLQQYKEKEAKGLEHYFVIQNSAKEELGVVRLYNIQGQSFSWGSWILKPNAPIYAAIESALTIYELGFNIANFQQSHFEVRKGNDSVIAFHKRFGAVEVGEDDLELKFVLQAGSYSQVKQRYKKYF